MRKKTSPFRHILCMVCFFSYHIQAQEIQLEISPKDSLTSAHPLLQHLKEEHSTLESLANYLQEFKTSLETKGYLNPIQNFSKKSDSSYKVSLDLRTKVDSISIDTSELTDRPPFLSTKNDAIRIPIEDTQIFLKKLNHYYHEKGATFHKIELTHIQSIQKNLFAHLRVSKTSLRKIDKIITHGYSLFPKRFISKHLQLKPHIVFNKNLLKKTNERLQSLDFITQTAPPKALFTKDSTMIYLYLQKRKANVFDGLVGFSNRENSKKIRLNGYLTLLLKNTFHRGETISFEWKNNGDDLEQLFFSTESPYIYNSPFSPAFEFKLQRKDSSFVNTRFNFDVGVALNFNHQFFLSVDTESSQSNLVVKTGAIQNFSKTNYGVIYQFVKNHSENGKPTTSLSLLFKRGQRSSENEVEKQFLFASEISHRFQIFGRNTLFLKNKSELIDSSNLLNNELYFLGGTNTIRGFNELSLQASAYNYTNAEYQFSTDSFSYLYLFADVGFLKNNTLASEDTLLGTGIGYSYRTPSGNINISYALGKTNKTSFDLEKGLFHIKFVSYF